ncbi:hypothetical protein PLICRDRAFT_46544 [Plicaturopsis crispa FD-325 SS-3]|uniref:Uncharacterized protein n=1 Tax=Plicaturopsis crispa FD-325 SS-3 TaxID=944288 RepID=A0A0C9T4E9_PLICR|nr:hypothetical protein PLICRDRAFT_46544 [Plicaturopsis crispa FD-325 SS-3]
MILSAAFPAGSHIVFVDLAEAMAIDDDDAGDLVRLDEEGTEACLASCACCDEHWIPVQEWAKEGPLPNGLEYPDPYQT